MIDVYFTPTPNGHKVSIMLEEVGLPHQLLAMNMLEGDHLTPEYRRINPNGRLPAIIDHDPIGGVRRCPYSSPARSCFIWPRRAGSCFPKIRGADRRRSNG